MLNSARLFSLLPATSLSSRPPLPSTPRGTAQLETPERQSHDPGKVLQDQDADTNQNPTTVEYSFILYYAM